MPEGRPNVDDLYDLCTETIELHGQRDTMFTDLEDYYFLEGKKKDGEGADEGIEVVHLPHATNAIDLVQDLLSDSEPTIVVPASGEGPKRKKLAVRFKDR